MSIYFIGWLVSVILWVFFMVGLVISKKMDDFDLMVKFNILQVSTLIPMWIFLFLELRG